MQLIDGGE